MKIAIRNVIDILIALVLVVVLLWCGVLAWGAYSQHRLALLVNASVLMEMKDAIQNQTTGTTLDLAAKSAQEIARLQEAQEKLFDANSVSFIYQFVTLIILTISVSLLAIMYKEHRREQEYLDRIEKEYRGEQERWHECLDKAEKERMDIFSALAPFAAGQNTCVVVATKYCLLYTLCCLYKVISDPERNSLLIMIADYQNDILRHLEDALREKEGLAPLWHEVILDMSERIKYMLINIRGAVEDVDRALAERVFAASLECYNILWDYGKEFNGNYNDYWRKLTGKEPPTREWE